MPNQFGAYQTGDVMIDGQWVNERDALYAKYGDLAGQMELEAKSKPAKTVSNNGNQYFAYDSASLAPTGGVTESAPTAYPVNHPAVVGISDPSKAFSANGQQYIPKEYVQFQQKPGWLEDFMDNGPGVVALSALGGALAGGAFGAGGTFGAGGASGAGGALGTGAVDYGLTAGGLPSLSTYGAAGLAGTGTPMLSTYGMGGLAGTGTGSLGALAGTAGLTGAALAGSGDWLSSAKGMYDTASTAAGGAGLGGQGLKGAGLIGSALAGSGGASNSLSPSTGGKMPNTNWAQTLSPFLGAYNTYDQSGKMSDVYDKAYNLITTPSPDQQKYRDQLSQLMSNPGSMETSPVYRAMADQGMNAVNRTAAAKGMLGSGNRLVELNKVGQDTAAKYYFPQQQDLAQLANVQGDSAQRTLGAGSLIEGQGMQTAMSNRMLKDAMVGAAGLWPTPEQQLVNSLMGNSGGTTGNIGSTIENIGSGISDWWNGQNAGNYNEASSVMPYIDPWSSYEGSSGVDWSQYLNTPDYTGSSFTLDPSWFR